MAKKTPQKIKNNKYERREGVKKSATFIVIAVEGVETEMRYFKMLQSEYENRLRLEIIPPEENKSAPKKILEKLRAIKKNYQMTGVKPDSYWMVCDVDNHPKIQQVICDAKDDGFKVAISNPCFEIWLCLHKGDIKINQGFVSFYDGCGAFVEEIDVKKVQLKKLSQKVAQILNKVKCGLKSCGCKGSYLKHVEDAIGKSARNLKSVKGDNFLTGKNNIGQTGVGKLVSQIIKIS